MAPSSVACSACRIQRKRCDKECELAPYFPPDQPHKFACLHQVFGVSSILKLLKHVPSHQREDFFKSLVFEAERRIKDPVYGCVHIIAYLRDQNKKLQDQNKKLQDENVSLRNQLATNTGPQALLPILQQDQWQPQQRRDFMPQTERVWSATSSSYVHPQHLQHSLFPKRTGEVFNRQQQQNLFEANVTEAADGDWQHNETLRAYGERVTSRSHDDHHQNQPEDIWRFAIDSVPTGTSTATGFNQLTPSGTTVTDMYHQQQQQQDFQFQQHSEMFRAYGEEGGSSSHANQLPSTVNGMSPSLALGGDSYVDSSQTNHTDQQLHHYQQRHEPQLFMPPQRSQLQQQPHEDQMFMPSEYSQSQQQLHDAQLYVPPSQSSQPLPLQTQETQTSLESDKEGTNTISSSR